MGSRAMRVALLAFSHLYVLRGASAAAVYQVGTAQMPNWTLPVNGSVNYTEWASNVTVRVGDSLYFKYNSNYHNVLKVNSTSYAACDNKNYLQVWDSGDTTVVIEEPGMHYFMCGAPTHCQKLQAFSILALPSLEPPPPPSLNPPPPPNTSSPGTGSSPSSVGATLNLPLLSRILILSFIVLITSSLRL